MKVSSSAEFDFTQPPRDSDLQMTKNSRKKNLCLRDRLDLNGLAGAGVIQCLQFHHSGLSFSDCLGLQPSLLIEGVTNSARAHALFVGVTGLWVSSLES
jgi:hypothetical protein